MALPAHKISHGGERRLAEVSLSLDGKRVVFVFENSEGYTIPRERLPGNDGSPIVAMQIADHRHAVTVSQASGANYDLPWDSIKHYARGGRQRRPVLGKRLRILRKALRLSQTALARATGLSRMQLARLEKGTSSPTLETLLQLSQALHVAPHELLQATA